MLVRTFLFLSIPSVLQLASAQTCYFPDGTVSADVPCGSGSGPTHCCDSGSVCLDNGLCMSTEYQPFTLSRASCTDRTWTSSKCPIYCLQEASYNHSGCAVISYTFLNNIALYCCNDVVSNTGNTPCDHNQSAFQIQDAKMIPGYAALTAYTLKNNSSSPNSTNSTLAGNSTSSSSSSNHDTAIGAGVGVPLGVIAVAAIAWALWERSKLRRITAQQPQGTYIPFQQPALQRPNYKAELSSQEPAAAELDGR